MARDINQLHPKVRELALKLVSECSKNGIDIKITECFRSVAEQDEFYSWGRTKINPNTGKMTKVTNAKGSTKSSYHQWGLAFDICINSKTAPYDSNLLTKAGKIGQSLGLTWGGSWTKPNDKPHFQYTFGLTLNDLRAGKRPPVYVIDDFKLKLDSFVKRGIISSPQYWIENAKQGKNCKGEYVRMFISNYCGKPIDVALKHFKSKGLISTVEGWQQEEIKGEYVKNLIEKLRA